MHEDFKIFYKYKNSLSVIDGILMCGYKVVPVSLRNQILNPLHESHMGTTKMKSLARSYVWWPGLNNEIQQITKKCETCTNIRQSPPKSVLKVWDYQDKPFDRIHIDYLGPIFNKHVLVVIDAYSKWPEVFFVSGPSSQNTINCLRSLFARFGFPRLVVSDNATAFLSEKFQNFLKLNGI